MCYGMQKWQRNISSTFLFHFIVLAQDLGEVFKPIPDFLGIFRDPHSKYLFNISTTSILFDYNLGETISREMEAELRYLYDSLFVDLPAMVSEESTTGAGAIIEVLLRYRG